MQHDGCSLTAQSQEVGIEGRVLNVAARRTDESSQRDSRLRMSAFGGKADIAAASQNARL
jgi:hypothetical protein